jgi:hypothetical protein
MFQKWSGCLCVQVSHSVPTPQGIAFTDGLRERLGLEGLVMFKKDTHTFDAENYTITIPKAGGGEVTVGVFDKVVVEVSIEKDVNTQRGKVKMVLVEPVISDGL